MRTEHETTISDAEGKEHRYETTQFAASDGLRIFQRVLDSLAHPAGALLSAFQSGGALPDSTNDALALLLDDGISGEALGKALEVFVRKVGADMDLFSDILRHTYRDGDPLARRATFDNAYQGNYFELFSVVAWVLKVNFSSMLPKGGLPFVKGG